MRANAYFEHYAHALPVAPLRNLDAIIPEDVGRRDYLARLYPELAAWAPEGWMEQRGDWRHQTGAVEVKLKLSEARTDPESGKQLRTQGRTSGPAQATNKSDVEECDVLIAAQGDEELAAEYREVLGIPVVVLENLSGMMPFEKFDRRL
jgi:hypothetical protein